MKNTLLVTATLAVGVALVAPQVAAGPTTAPKITEIPTVPSVARLLEGVKWNVSSVELVKMYNQPGGIFDKDYDPLLMKVQPGVQQRALEADRDAKKKSFEASRVEFRDMPTGFDATPLKGEYTYRNNESLMSIERQGVRTYFFFFGAPPNDRLWKVYREIKLSEGGPMGNSFQECVTKLNTTIGIPARIRGANPTQGLPTTTADWQDGDSYMRAMDRSSERICAVSLAHRGTMNNLSQLRSAKSDDPMAMDPAIAQITRKEAEPTPAPSGRGATPAPKKK